VRFSHPVVVQPREYEIHGAPATDAIDSGVTSLPSLSDAERSSTPALLYSLMIWPPVSVNSIVSDAARSMTPVAETDESQRGAAPEPSSKTSITRPSKRY